MTLIVIVVVLALLFGGGGYYGYSRGSFGGASYGTGVGGLLLLLLVLYVLGVFGPR